MSSPFGSPGSSSSWFGSGPPKPTSKLGASDDFDDHTNWGTALDATNTDLLQAKRQQDDLAAILGHSSHVTAAIQKTQPGMSIGQPQYLTSNKRGLFERATFAAGCSYLAGITLGGAKGFVVGLRNAPSRRWRIRVNSVLNACGRGARLGNALGVLAMTFTLFEGGYEYVDLERHIQLTGQEWVNPLAAAASTGLFYRSTAGLPVALASGAVGLTIGALFFIGLPYARENLDVPLLRYLHL